jgi:hypothetical protein
LLVIEGRRQLVSLLNTRRAGLCRDTLGDRELIEMDNLIVFGTLLSAEIKP